MAKYLNQQSIDLEVKQKRCKENESRRQLDLLGVEDSQERAEIKKAHQAERENERLADQRAEKAIVQAAERARKKRKGKPQSVGPSFPSLLWTLWAWDRL